mmetsp:Transcript_46938/g.101087  ORF Transcript_46938/g.101087 Transcript_46938/m.101087 type:complete len:207 (-) Transcript_46938:310-930(-)
MCSLLRAFDAKFRIAPRAQLRQRRSEKGLETASNKTARASGFCQRVSSVPQFDKFCKEAIAPILAMRFAGSSLFAASRKTCGAPAIWSDHIASRTSWSELMLCRAPSAQIRIFLSATSAKEAAVRRDDRDSRCSQMLALLPVSSAKLKKMRMAASRRSLSAGTIKLAAALTASRRLVIDHNAALSDAWPASSCSTRNAQSRTRRIV